MLLTLILFRETTKKIEAVCRPRHEGKLLVGIGLIMTSITCLDWKVQRRKSQRHASRTSPQCHCGADHLVGVHLQVLSFLGTLSYYTPSFVRIIFLALSRRHKKQTSVER